MDKLKGHETPINKTAALVVSKGYSYETKTIHSPTLFSENGLKTKSAPVNTKDLIGVKFGRFVVIGFSADRKSKWVVRCSCGNYEVRSAKCVNAGRLDQMCIKCYSSLQAIKKADWAVGKGRDFEEYVKDRI
ncbi:MAG TPA: hypothetical protein EYN67_13510 [Flavobacteriales bacterium]|nr:hypothetical protein [Flavobacteriales bacterium]